MLICNYCLIESIFERSPDKNINNDGPSKENRKANDVDCLKGRNTIVYAILHLNL